MTTEMTPEMLAWLTDDERAAWEASTVRHSSLEYVHLARTALPAALLALAKARAALEAETDARQRCRECTAGPLFGEENA